MKRRFAALIGKKIVGVISRQASTSVVGVIFDDGTAATFTDCEIREAGEIRDFLPKMTTLAAPRRERTTRR